MGGIETYRFAKHLQLRTSVMQPAHGGKKAQVRMEAK
jgi:hypothetical protein